MSIIQCNCTLPAGGAPKTWIGQLLWFGTDHALRAALNRPDERWKATIRHELEHRERCRRVKR